MTSPTPRPQRTPRRGALRVVGVSVRAMLVFTLVLGVGYTAAITAVGQLAFGDSANGALLRDTDGTVVGSSRLGQAFTDAGGEPLPQYFQSRPSAAGDGYDAASSSGSNLGPESPDLVAAITERRAGVAALEGVAESAVPPDAVTASASGLDPHISPAYASIQVGRVAAARGLEPQTVRGLVAQHTQAPDLGYLGETVVNVVELNRDLDQQGE
ncbi:MULTISPECIES: K(+)-transporting ATPase subunit C [unclassified Microbacterium]|uniref:K(+)-transporting ATPase subunit C n=1 Tax=unclassified Microbacterium TaxID=2609290 RepID=UPI003862ECF1